MNTKSIDPTNDLLFKKALASPEHLGVLKGFIQDFFGFEPQEIILENPYSIDDYKELLGGSEVTVLRETRPDIRASLKTASFTAEMQVNQVDFFDSRALYYACDAYCANYNRQDNTKRPNRYGTLVPVYAMNILKHTSFKDDDRAVRVFELRDNITGAPMRGKLLNVGFFELTKEQAETENQLHWRNFFLTGKVSENAPDYIREAAGIVDYVNLSREEQTMYDMAEKARATREAEMSYAIRTGMEKGIAAGKAAGRAEVLDELRRRGVMIPEGFEKTLSDAAVDYPTQDEEESGMNFGM